MKNSRQKHIQWNKQIPWSSVMPIVTIVTFFVTIVTIILCIVVNSNSYWIWVYSDQEMRHSIDNSYQTSRITYCYDNEIHPCTDDAITTWNKKHPAEASFSPTQN
ncbi:MAG: hypothetical protein WA087_00875 [Candidatus Saccharimonadales bacterium]